MKNKKIILLFILLFITSGCTRVLYDSDRKVVKQPETEQNLTENIICKPENAKTLETYRNTYKTKLESLNKKLENHELTQNKYDAEIEKIVDVDQLVSCTEFKVTSGGYEGLWTSIFVKPLSWLLLNIGKLLNNYGLSIIFITLAIRTIMMPITKKTAVQSENMKSAKPELDKLESKYKGKTDQDSQMKKSQEMMIIYKKYNINPVMGCVFAFIQIPLFFAFYEAMSRTPLIFEGAFGPFQLGVSPMTALLRGEYLYLLLAIFVIGGTYFSFKLNASTSSLGEDSEKQMKMMTNIMTALISITAFSISTGIALYWIFNSGFTVIQNLLVKRSKENVRNNKIRN